MTNVSKIMTHNGRFYEGMTLKEAKELGRDKTWWRRDFSDIDTDQNGFLSAEEIFTERDKTANDLKSWGYFSAVFSVIEGALSMKNYGKIGIIELCADALVTFLFFNSSKKIKKDTDEMRAEYNKNQEATQKLSVNA